MFFWLRCRNVAVPSSSKKSQNPQPENRSVAAPRQAPAAPSDGAKVAILEIVGYELKKKDKKEKAKKEEPVEAVS
ncbi:MAG: hypothetical protein WA817_15685 [Candidatus Acidiferrum sp.]